MVLSDVGGHSVAEPGGAVLRQEELRPLLKRAYRALAEHGITHDDLKLDNYRLVENEGEDKVMIVDFEFVNRGIPEDEIDSFVEGNTVTIMRHYKDHLKNLEHDKLLLPRKYPEKKAEGEGSKG